MSWYVILALGALIVCLVSCIYHAYKIISLGNPVDYSEPIGNTMAGIAYSCIGAMSPTKKESAYLHLPTYTAGILFHIGTFLSIILFFSFVFSIQLPVTIQYIFSAFLVITGICGLAILIKRILKSELRSLSNPDDYISNSLVTAFQLATVMQLFYPTVVYYIIATLLLLYLPIGKLKHVVYFFAARYHLGLFFGRRGTWPPKSK